ncbi:MAG: 2-dehydropantoate 2-reductase N-terminal domain-containing protein [Sphaerochaeta sp.]|uniref:mannitol dehydrogenase family protein n=1 Tax=Sphaerochaeta sp. TaxID=1972642 RepID=UPI003D0BDADC
MNFTILGAGKTGRGFLARLVQEAGQVPVLLDSSLSLITTLRDQGQYTIEFFGRERPDLTLQVPKAYHTEEPEALEAIAQADILLVSVGASNLEQAGSLIKAALDKRTETNPLLIITAENAINPAMKLNKAIRMTSGQNEATKTDSLSFLVTEAAIFCSTIEKPGSAVDILSEAYDQLPYDALKAGSLYALPSSFVPEMQFPLLLTRKIYTYNCSSAAIAYLGSYLGYAWYADAANDPRIIRVLDALYGKINRVLCKAYAIDSQEQEQFAVSAKHKFQNQNIRDSIERNARDVMRKLAPDERLVGPLLLAEQQKLEIEPLELVIAAAIWYALQQNEQAVSSRYKQEGVAGLVPQLPNAMIQRIETHLRAFQTRTKEL